MAHLTAAGLRDQVCVLLDGGIRRGSDVFKAVALGACAVGISRPLLYALASYGQEVSGCLSFNVCAYLCMSVRVCVSVCVCERVMFLWFTGTSLS